MSARAWIAFAAVSTLWGIPYLFIKVAIDDGMPPVFLAWARVVLGAAILIGLSWRLGLLPSLRGRWRVLALLALVEITLPFPLIAAGEQGVSSSLAAILIAAVPLLVALLALRFDHAERATGRRLVGLVLGFVGVIALVGLDATGSGSELLGAGAILLAALGYAIGPMIIKRRLADVDPRASLGAALAIAAVLLTGPTLAAPPAAMPSAEAIVAVIVLGVLCTAMAFVFFGSLVAEVGPGRATVITYVAPIVAVACGVAVLGERPGAGAIAGLLLIIAGSWLSTDGRVPPGLGAIITRVRTRRGRAGSGYARGISNQRSTLRASARSPVTRRRRRSASFIPLASPATRRRKSTGGTRNVTSGSSRGREETPQRPSRIVTS
jgi:drug/metabolite transporter (DMT)-like permease